LVGRRIDITTQRAGFAAAKPADAATAMAAVLKAAAEGELTPMEAGEVAKLLDISTISSAAAAK
jgi:hypothetical protein